MSSFRLVIAARSGAPAGVFQFFVFGGALPVVEAEICAVLKDSGLFMHYPAFEKYMSGTRSDPAVLLISSASEAEIASAVLTAVAPSKIDPPAAWSFAPFAASVRSLAEGHDRNALQLAVQFLSADGLDDSLVAAEYDWDFLQRVREDLEKKKR